MSWDTYSQAMSRVGTRIRNTPFDYHVYTHSFPHVVFKGRGRILPTWQGEAVWAHPVPRVNWVPLLVMVIVVLSVVIGDKVLHVHEYIKWRDI